MLQLLMHDSHIHLALEPLKTNILDVVKSFKDDGGKYILTQGTDIVDFQDTLDLANKSNLAYPNIVDVALGLHPTFFEEVTIDMGVTDKMYEISQKKIQKFEEIFNLRKESVKAIGETGLDYFQFNTNQEELKEIQKISFRRHLQLALQNDLPLSIHARDIQGNKECVKDVLTLVAEEGKGRLRGSFHSYTDDISFVDDILDLGFYIGFNGIITYKSGENVREILRKVPIERILFETDGPFLPPQSVRKDKKVVDKYAQPIHIKEIINVAAEVKGLDSKYFEDATDRNYEDLFL